MQKLIFVSPLYFMKLIHLFLLTASTAVLLSCGSGKKVSSPNGAITAEIVQKDDRLELKISHRGSEAAQWQIGGVAFTNKEYDFTGKLKQKGVSFSKIDEKYTLPTGKVSTYQNKANEMKVNYANAYGKNMQLLVRAYNDGIAFRYAFENAEIMQVKEENTMLTIPETSNMWAMEHQNDAEGFYLKRPLSEMTKPLYALPALVETPNGKWLLIHEADVLGRSAAASLSEYKGDGKFAITTTYPGFGSGDLKTVMDSLAKNPMKDWNTIIASPKWATPWRMMIVGDTPGTIVESTMTENLNPPSVLEDDSWIKPGVTAFPWWSNNHANSDKEILKKFIDMAQAMKWTVIEFDISLIGSAFTANDAWLTTPWIREVVDYANERGVRVYGWDERKNLDTPEKRAFIYGKYRELGVDGIKIDYVNSFAQNACDFRQVCLSDAIKYKQMVSFHGEYTPRGERRTYPNLVTQEGIRASEYYLFARDHGIPSPSHNATVPYTRNVVGPMDYTPTVYSMKRRTTSYAHETALPFVFESGWVCMSDAPEYYLNSPARPLLQEIEATWDEIKFLAGYPGEYIVIARRKGQKWAVGALNAGAARTVTIPLDFLSKNHKSLLICEDDKTDPRNQCKVHTVSIENEKSFTFEMAENGGFVAITKY